MPIRSPRASRLRKRAIAVVDEPEEGVQLTPIKVADVDYWDDLAGKWREHLLGDIVVQPGEASTRARRNLEHVGASAGRSSGSSSSS